MLPQGAQGCEQRPEGPQDVRAGLSLREASEPLHPAAMETYKYFSHLSEKDLVIWQVWFQNVPEVCIQRSPGCERRQAWPKLDYS